jgi:hypothetical protein
MAVTKQTYTASATWTASGLASIFRSAFIDAGLMTEWHDSFLNTIENRVLEITYNGSKTYGKTYHWFQFTTSGVFYAQAASWNAAGDVPSGTQYLDFFATTTNATTNHVQFLALSTATTVTLTRYTSGSHTFFVLRTGSSYYTFGIDHSTVSLQSWANLDNGYHNGMVNVVCSMLTGSTAGGMVFQTPYRLRRSFLDGCVNNGSTNIGTNYNDPLPTSAYSVAGVQSNSTSNVWGFGGALGGAVLLPFGSNATNPGFSADFNPVYTGLRHLSTVANNLPADFGFTASRTNNANAIQDTLTVTAGVEVWEVLAFTNASGTTGQASPLFVARTT